MPAASQCHAGSLSIGGLLAGSQPSPPLPDKILSCDWPLQVPSIDVDRVTSDLCGGYRRIPVLQSGAELYCDTEAISRELEIRFPTPERTAAMSGADWALIAWADKTIFSSLVSQMDFEALGAEFIADREKLMGMPLSAAPAEAVATLLPQLKTHLQLLEEALSAPDASPFLGGELPGVVDAAMWAHVWFLQVLSAQPSRPLLAEHTLASMPALQSWAARMAAVGESEGDSSNPITAGEAMAIATAAVPTGGEGAVGALDAAALGLHDGQTVGVMEAPAGTYTVVGQLLSTTVHTLTLEREHAVAGKTRVHLPRNGYTVLPARASL